MTSHITALVREKTADINLQADNIENNLFHSFNRFHGIASVISRDTDVLRAISRFGAGTYPKSLNVERRKEAWSKNVQLKTVGHYLNLVNASLGLDVIYIINASGDCIASSNADKPDSFVGSNFASREYFRLAMEGKPWHQYATGKVSNIPGLYFSAPIVNEGHIVGVVATKINLPDLQQWINLANTFIADQYGVIIFASDAKLEMHALPGAAIVGLSRETRRTRYKHEEFPVLAIKPWPGQLHASLLRFDEENHPGILANRTLAKDGISIHVFWQIPEIADITQEQLIQFMLLAISGLLAIIFIRSRIAFDHIRKQSELQLRNSEESLREAQIIASLGSYVLDIHSGLWEGSDMLERLFGIDKAYEHSASGWEALIHPDDRTMMNDYLRNEVLGEGKAFDKEYRIIRQNDQAMRWVHGQGKLVFDTQGNPLKMFGTVQDITERKLVEQELHDSENRYRNLVETTGDLVWEVDENAVYTYVSPRAFAITHYQPAELIGTTPFDQMAPEEAKRVASLFAKIAASQQAIVNLENTRLHKDGHPIVFESSGVPILGTDGKLCGYRGIDRDITERKLAEQTTIDEKNFSNTLIASQPDVFYVFDQSGRFIRWNQKLKEILGLSDAQLVVTNALDVIHEADRPVVAQKIQETFEQGAATINARLITKIGIRDYVFNATSAETEKGMYLIGVGTDITERNCAEEKLRRSDTHLAEAQQISHVGSWEMDHVTNKIHWSVEAFRIFEQDPASFVPNFETFLDTVHPDDRDMLKETFGRSLQEHTPYEIEHRLLIKDGRIKYVHEQGSTIYDEQGRPLSTVGTVQDITDRIQSDRQIKIFRSLLDSAPDEIQVVDPATLRIIDVNESACIKLGYTREEFLALRAPDIDTAEPETHRANGERLLKDGFATFETRHKRKDGTTFPVEITLRIVTLDQPYTLAIARDITERKRAEQVLVDNEAKFRTVTNAVMDAILMIDDDGLIVSWNPAAERILGYSVQDAIGRNAHQLFVPSRYYADFKKGFASFRETGLGPVIGKKLELDALRKDGSEFPVELLISAIRLNERWHAVGIVRDITERKRVEAEVQKLQEQLREQALHDPLTGLYNRRYLDETIKRELARAERYNLPVGIVMCDLDHFKHVNDTHGHLAGDEVLRLFAELLKNHARGSDIVCRFGGEEFVMLLPDMPPAVTYQRAEQLRTEFAAKQIRLGAAVIQVTASFGVATFPENGKTMDSLISAVDAAMYQAKETGRNRVVIASAHE